jgi:hypothetical protein
MEAAAAVRNIHCTPRAASEWYTLRPVPCALCPVRAICPAPCALCPVPSPQSRSFLSRYSALNSIRAVTAVWSVNQ